MSASICPMKMCLSVFKMELWEVEDDVVQTDENVLTMFIQSTPVLRVTADVIYWTMVFFI